jgi:hypothetical protein
VGEGCVGWNISEEAHAVTSSRRVALREESVSESVT